MWVRHKECEVVVKKGCREGRVTNFVDLVLKLGMCGDVLTVWNKEVFGNVQQSIKRKEAELKGLLSNVQDLSEATKIEKCRKELSEFSIREEIL